MKKKLTSFAATVAMAMAALAAAPVLAQVSVPLAAAEGGRLWFIELTGEPGIEGRAEAAVRSEHAAFRAAAAAAGLKYSERRSFSSLFNGLAASIAPKDRARFARLPGVKAMHPIEQLRVPAPETAAGTAIDLASAITMTGASSAQATLGLSGRGVKVGIIDTGIDIDHPAFGGHGVPGGTSFPTARVVAGHDFVGDNFDSGGEPAQQVPVPDPNPDDCNGHGTHVAGIVGGNGGGFKGVAPAVKFGAYRVFGCDGSTSSDILLAAMERAHADGMDVINQSLGSGRQWPQYPTAQAASRLVNKGIVMVASIGNNGPGGSSPDALFAAGAPGTGKNVIGVASFDNQQRSFAVNGTPYGYTPAAGAPLPPSSGSLPMAKTGTPTTANDGCTALPAGSLSGKAVLIRRGTCSFFIKASNAQAAGAAAVVLYNNVVGALNATVAGTPAITIPVVGIMATQGATLDALIAAGPTTLNWSTVTVSFPFGTGGLISSFSSFGLAADLSLKPDIGAPGGGIFSSYPLEQGGSATLSGTSMAAPHVAGLAALILEARPHTPPKQVGAMLQNTARPQVWSDNPGLGLLDFSFRQGAGMADVVSALRASASVSPSDISLGESEDGPRAVTITLKSRSRAWQTWTVTHEPTIASGPNLVTAFCPAAPCPPQPAAYARTNTFDAPATVTFDRTTVVMRGFGEAEVTATFAAPAALPDRSLYGGYVKFTSDSGEVLRVPYGGLKGDYQSTKVLTPTVNGFPWLASLVGPDLLNQPAGAVYTMTGDDIPFLLFHLDHLSRRVLLEVRDAISGRHWGKVSDDHFVTRNSTPNGAFVAAWDGSTFRGNPSEPSRLIEVPNGQYRITVRVLKALGDADRADHWETWESPVITVARPWSPMP